MECPRCGQVLSVKNFPAGQSVTCPVCACQFDPSAPAAPATGAPSRATHGATPMLDAAKARSDASSSWTAVITVAIILLFFVMLGYVFFRYGGSVTTSQRSNKVIELPSETAKKEILLVGTKATLTMPKPRPDVPDGGYVAVDKRDVENVRQVLAGNYRSLLPVMLREKRVFLLQNTFPVQVVDYDGPVAKITVLQSANCPYSGQTGFVPALWLHEIP